MGQGFVLGRNLGQDSQGFQKYFINRFVYGMEFLIVLGVCRAIDILVYFALSLL